MALRFILSTVLMLSLPAFSLTINNDFKVAKHVEYSYLIGDLSFSDVERNTHHWQQAKPGNISLGTSETPVWLKVPIENNTNRMQTLYLVVDFPRLDEVSLYHREDNRLKVETIGDSYPLSVREIKDSDLLFKVNIAANKSQFIYIKAASSGLLKLPVTIWNPSKYVQHKNKATIIDGLILGALITLIAILLALFALTKKRQFLTASIYSFLLWLMLATTLGYVYRYISDDVRWLSQMLIPMLLLSLSIIMTPLSTRFQKRNKSSTIITRILLVVCSLILLLLPLFSFANALIIAFSIGIANIFWHALVTSYSIYHRKRHCKLLLLAQLSIFCSFAFNLLALMGVQVPALKTGHSFIITFIISAFSFSYILIEQYVLLRDSKVSRQQKQLAEANMQQEVQNEAIKIHEQYQEELENKIQERTFELEVTLRELQEKNHELEEMNTQDALTSLRNRRYFDKKITMEFRRSRREQTPLALVMLDIDHFKRINDTYGHLSGDDVIKHVAMTIKHALKRPSDVACRYGGEEFALILPNTDDDGALSVAEHIRSEIEKTTINSASIDIKITISAGIFSSIADQSSDPNYYTDLADKALYHAKNSGRNKVCSANKLITEEES